MLENGTSKSKILNHFNLHEMYQFLRCSLSNMGTKFQFMLKSERQHNQDGHMSYKKYSDMISNSREIVTYKGLYTRLANKVSLLLGLSMCLVPARLKLIIFAVAC